MSSQIPPTNKKEWFDQSQALITNVLATATVPMVTQETDFNELIKAIVVGATASIPIIGGGISTIIDAIWSHVLANQTSQQNELTKMYMKMVKEVVDQSISLYDNTDLVAEYAGISSYIKTFRTKLANSTAKPANASLKDEMRDAYTAAEQKMRAALVPKGVFRKVGYEVSELMMFAVAATTHLLFLRQVIANGKKWGFPDVTVSDYKTAFKGFIVEYTTHCKTTYTTGWYKINSKVSDPTLCGLDIFNLIIKYRNGMITSVFDYASMWYTFDQDNFPNGATSERVRYLWTDIQGWTIDVNKPVPGVLIGDNLYYNPPANQFYNYWDTVMIHEAYRGQLHHVEFTANPFIYTITPYYFDQTQTAGFRKGLTVGNNLTIGTKTTMTFPVSGATQTVSMNSDVNVRKIQISGVSTVLDLPQPAPGRSDHNNPIAYYYDSCKFPYVQSTYTYKSHKVGDLFGIGLNMDSWMKDYQPNGGAAITNRNYGFIDSVCVGLMASEVFPENILAEKCATIVDPQKAFFRDTGVVFKKDFTMVGQHAYEMSDKELMKIQFDLEDPSVFAYTLRIRMTCTNGVAGKISVLNANAVLLSTFNYTAAGEQFITSDAEPDYVFMFYTDKPTKLWFKNLTGTAVIQSIIFTPVSPQPTPPTPSA
eukprot:gene18228-21808_t